LASSRAAAGSPGRKWMSIATPNSDGNSTMKYRWYSSTGARPSNTVWTNANFCASSRAEELALLSLDSDAVWLTRRAGGVCDPSLRLKNGYAQDDTTNLVALGITETAHRGCRFPEYCDRASGAGNRRVPVRPRTPRDQSRAEFLSNSAGVPLFRLLR
jgi:hypothetical protein